MPEKQGSLALLNEPVAQKLLNSATLAHLAFNWTDGTPRVVPIWFQWTGEEVVFCSVGVAKKLKAIGDGTRVAITIDGSEWPYPVLMLRGTVAISLYPGIVPGYRETAIRYIGEQNGGMFIGAIESTGLPMKRIGVMPDWVGVIDFQTRWPGQT